MRDRSASDDDLVREARDADILETARRCGAKLKRTGHEWVGPCPACGGRDRFGVNARKGVFVCRGAAGGDVIAMVQHCESLSFKDAVRWVTGRSLGEERDAEAAARAAVRRTEAARKQAAEALSAERSAVNRNQAARRIWDGGVPIAGTPAEAYLRARGIDFDVSGFQSLRFLAALPYPAEHGGGSYPALVGCVVGPMPGAPAKTGFRGVWRIYLAPDGSDKAPVPNPKLGLGPCVPGAIYLGAPLRTVHVCEGLETGLGVRGILGPGHSIAVAMSTSGMKAYVPPTGITAVTIWPDGDTDRIERSPRGEERHRRSPGLDAARALMERMQAAGIKAVIQPPPSLGNDFLDIYRAAKAAAGL